MGKALGVPPQDACELGQGGCSAAQTQRGREKEGAGWCKSREAEERRTQVGVQQGVWGT